MPFDLKTQRLINSFRGVPDWSEGSCVPLNRVQSVDNLINALLLQNEVGHMNAESMIQAHWVDVLGPQMAPLCVLRKIDSKGCLHIGVSDAVARQELNFERQRLLKEFRNLPECQYLKKIRIGAVDESDA
jgi:hypothetical protein